MNRSFEENRQMAEDALIDMEYRRLRMMRTYNNYMKHGAVNAAAELLTEMEALESDIDCEKQIYKLTFL